MIGTILYNIFIMPLELLFQILYQFGGKYPILGILLISIVMNFLALPLYMRADAIQEEERKGIGKLCLTKYTKDDIRLRLDLV